MQAEFEQKVADFIKVKGLYESGERVLLAVSGGTDSSALLHVMCSLKTAGVLDTDFVCGHLNHQLRGAESEGDEVFVVAETRRLGLETVTRRIDVRGFSRKNKLSIETAARELRIRSLMEIARAEGCRCIATAHQMDDNTETVVGQLARGTGFRGLGGIRPMRVFGEGIRFVRPLLCVRRTEVVEYLKEEGLKWREDATNKDCGYRRNYIRHRLLPAIQGQCKDPLAEQLLKLSECGQRFYSLVSKLADEAWVETADFANGKVVIDLKGFLSQGPEVQVELVRRGLTKLGSGERDLTQGHYERILELASQSVGGKQLELPGGFVVQREYEKLVFSRAKEEQEFEGKGFEDVTIEVPGTTRFGDYLAEAGVFKVELGSEGRFKAGKTSFVEWFDMDKLKPPLVVRSRRSGERFIPLGQRGEKKVGKFLTAQRVPQRIRRKVLIVADAEKIIWVWPIRMSEEAKVTGESRRILRLQITDAGPTEAS